MNATIKKIVGVSGTIIFIAGSVLMLSPEQPLVFDYCGIEYALTSQKEYEMFRDLVFANIESREEVDPCEFSVYTDLLTIEEKTNG